MFLHTAPDTVLALDAVTGQEMWRHTHTPESVSTRPAALTAATSVV